MESPQSFFTNSLQCFVGQAFQPDRLRSVWLESLTCKSEDTIKGPAARTRHDVRRVWECPVCQQRDWTGGQVVALLCHCLAQNDPPGQTWMQLLEPPRKGRVHEPTEPAPSPPPDPPSASPPAE